MKPSEINAHMKQHGWTASSVVMQSNAGTKKVKVWTREHEGDTPGPSDILLTLEDSDEVQVYRQTSRMPLGMVLSGKAPPA